MLHRMTIPGTQLQDNEVESAMNNLQACTPIESGCVVSCALGELDVFHPAGPILLQQGIQLGMSLRHYVARYMRPHLIQHCRRRDVSGPPADGACCPQQHQILTTAPVQVKYKLVAVGQLHGTCPCVLSACRCP